LKKVSKPDKKYIVLLKKCIISFFILYKDTLDSMQQGQCCGWKCSGRGIGSGVCGEAATIDWEKDIYKIYKKYICNNYMKDI
jgi:hypothetical protein